PTLLLAAILSFSSVSQIFALPVAYKKINPLHYSQMEILEPDWKYIEELADSALLYSRDKNTWEEAEKAMAELTGLYDHLYTSLMMSDVELQKDLNNSLLFSKHEDLTEDISRFRMLFGKLFVEFTNNGYILSKDPSLPFLWYFSITDQTNNTETPDAKHTDKLINEYLVILSASELNEEDIKRIEEIYLELVELYSKTASDFGVSHASDYFYLLHNIDIPSGTREFFYSHVKEHLAPLVPKNWFVPEFDMPNHEQLKLLEQTLNDYFPELKDNYDELLQNNLYYIGNDPGISPGAFTSFFPYYNTAYLYSQTTGDFSDYLSLIHEFGHFCSAAGKDIFEISSFNMNLAETHSQGFELLCASLAFDSQFGAGADIYSSFIVLDKLLAILEGCLFDEFQHRIYSDPPESTEEITAVFSELLKEYGLDGILNEQRWMLVHHNFRMPFYYISYAISALSSLELWMIAQTDPDAAKGHYTELLKQADEPFKEGLAAAGLNYPFEPQTLISITDELKVYVEELIAKGSPYYANSVPNQAEAAPLYQDISGHWAEAFIIALDRDGIVFGKDTFTFAPEEDLSRAILAQFVAAAFDYGNAEEKTGEPLSFSDVSPDAEYAEAISLLTSMGIMSGYGNKFGSDDSLSREQMAVVFYNALLYSGFVLPEPNHELLKFSDTDEISPWALDAVSVLFEQGAISGSNGEFSPQENASRAEVCSLLYMLVY
ncbi:MAG: S-layer homology domain-containing protein, partial [Firmicutes bacterium]|nr:S-layer homology domain-containing protein [Bacillota bacterium]